MASMSADLKTNRSEGLRGTRKRAHPRVIPYPALGAAAIILTLGVDAAAPVESMVRPLIIAVALTVAVQITATLITRNAMLGAYIAVLPMMVLVGSEAFVLAVGVLAVPVLIATVYRRRMVAIDWLMVTRTLNVGAAVLLVISIASGVLSGALDVSTRSSVPIAAAVDLPDVFLIMLDGYPRTDTLSEQFDIDNSPWLSQMNGLGFEVAANSRSNYNMTQLTLPSVFAFQHVLEQPGVRPGVAPADQWKSLSTILNRARGIDALHSAGYELTTITSPFSSTALTAADVVIDGGEIDEVETALLHRPLVRHILPGLQRLWFADQYRGALVDDFDTLERLAVPTDHPRFIFAHIFAPHPPFVFDAEGRPQEPAPCFPESCQLWNAGYVRSPDDLKPQLRGFLEWTDQKALVAVRAIQAKAVRPPIIVVFSDHGLRHDLTDRRETTTSMFMAATPGHPGLFPDDVTPINIIPRLLNAYAGTTLPLETEETYWTDMQTLDSAGPLTLVAVP
jgi:hypothetical protein